jgi:hypothetical protein
MGSELIGCYYSPQNSAGRAEKKPTAFGTLPLKQEHIFINTTAAISSGIRQELLSPLHSLP